MKNRTKTIALGLLLGLGPVNAVFADGFSSYLGDAISNTFAIPGQTIAGGVTFAAGSVGEWTGLMSENESLT